MYGLDSFGLMDYEFSKLDKEKQELIHKLTLLDTELYRCRGVALDGKYHKEPPSFRTVLADQYRHLPVQSLITLIALKQRR